MDVGLYRTHVVPRIVRCCCGMTPAATRARVCAVDPSDVGYRMAGRLVAGASVPVERIALDSARLHVLERCENSDEKGAPRPMGYLYEGMAVA